MQMPRALPPPLQGESTAGLLFGCVHWLLLRLLHPLHPLHRLALDNSKRARSIIATIATIALLFHFHPVVVHDLL